MADHTPQASGKTKARTDDERVNYPQPSFPTLQPVAVVPAPAAAAGPSSPPRGETIRSSLPSPPKLKRKRGEGKKTKKRKLRKPRKSKKNKKSKRRTKRR